MTLLQNWLTRSAHDWGISPRTAILLFLLPLVAGALLFLTWMRRDVFVFILAEDSIVEWLSAATFAGAAVFAAVLAWRQYRADHWKHSLLFGSIAALLVFLTGEEISWGQRLIGIETPEALSSINRQQEITVHNIGDLLEVFRLGMLFIGAYGVIVPLISLSDWWQQRTRLRRFVFVPPLFLTSSFLILFLFRLSRLTIYQYGGDFKRFEEFTELCLAFAILTILWLLARRDTRKAESATADDRVQLPST
ncbi:MAG: hypothetical protein IAE80_30235 [Anaerolinea sp.]|nr:hypothetical protein [Anaerolinea sp.]